MEYKELRTIIYSRKDLKNDKSKKKFKDIQIMDFEHCSDIYKYDIWIFVDDDFETKILKSRFTTRGIINNDEKRKNIFDFFVFNY